VEDQIFHNIKHWKSASPHHSKKLALSVHLYPSL
jgi:hypothetical protein